MDAALPTGNEHPGALSHLRVVELGDMPAAYCGRYLADLGADVIKIEPPGGDPNRWLPPFAGDVEDLERSLPFINANTNKRSIVLDLANSPSDRRTFARLAAEADILVEATPVGTLEALGFTQRRLLRHNPRLATVSITPFGQTGPYCRYKASNAIIEAMCGLLTVQGDDQQPPCVTPAQHGYQIAAIHAAYLALGAVRHARLTGAGQRIDLSLFEALTYLPAWAIARYAARGEIVLRTGTRAQGGAANLWRCKDGRYAGVFIFTLPHWHVLTREWMEDAVLSGPEWDEAEYRGNNSDVIEALLSEFVSQFTAEEFVAEAQRRGLAGAMAQTLGEFLNSPHMTARAWTQTAQHPVIGTYRAQGFPFRMSATPMRIRRPAPLLGQHQQEVLAELTAPRGRRASSGDGRTRRQSLLHGVRVTDLTHAFAGQQGTQFLGYYGAEVIKIESAGLYANRTAPLYQDANRNKLSCTVDTRHPRGKEIIRKLVAKSDLLIDNFSAHVVDRLGFGYEEAKKVKPDIIQITCPGMGRSGPNSTWVTWGNPIQAFTGLTHLWGHPQSPINAHSKFFLPDWVCSSLIVLAATAALEHRDQTGQGQFIEIAQVEGEGAMLGPAILDYTVNGREWASMGYREHLGASYAPYGCYPATGLDAWVVIACQTDEEWQGLVRVMGEPSWAQDPRFATRTGRRQHYEELDSRIAEWTAAYTPYQLLRLLQAAGVPAGVPFHGEDLYRDPHLRARGNIVEVDSPPWGRTVHPGLPGIPALSEAHANGPVPSMGAHNGYVFGQLLGMSEAEIRQGAEAGAIR